ncbi:MAG TPA: DUF418 domain-containing protein [Gaiellaceae bacterium]|nr:DUF418 domain-containing protein [Gaiellaceae bacterium]
MSAAAPVAPEERLDVLDALRGLAIFGIVFVNLQFFATPLFSVVEYRVVDDFPGTADRAAQWLVAVVAQGKLYPLLALLFGYGFGIQLERAGGAGGRYARRLAALFVLGVAHAVLLWAGDVLTAYAVVGAALALFRRKRDRTLLVWAADLSFVHVLLLVVTALAYAVLGDPPGPAIVEVTAAYRGSFAEVTAQRAADAAWAIPEGILGAGPGFLAMFLVGYWAQRRDLLRRVEEHRSLLRRAAVVGVAVGGAASIGFATLWWISDGRGGLAAASVALSSLALLQTLGYAAGLTLLAHGRGARLLAPFRPLGRLALSGYLLQSLLASLVFYGYGLGLYREVGPVAWLALAAAIGGACLALAGLWLRAFRIGPAEWLLRSVTYLRPQRLR